jgi:tetratricopeptide (TPR) repeat protein
VSMEEVGLAADHLEGADALFGKLVKPQRQLVDWVRGIRALLLHAQGRFEAASGELDEIQDQEGLMCLSVRAKLCLARGDFSQAERLLRKYLGLAGKYGPGHRPDVREQVLDLAESLLGGGKPDEAFDALEEARAITRDFALPTTPAWRRALADWLRRARDSSRTADAARLEAESEALLVSPQQAITVSPKFRLRRPE